MATYPLINGNRYDFSSVEITLNGSRTLGVSEVSYTSTLEPGTVFGTGSQVLGRTRGQLEESGAITLFKQEFAELVDALGQGFMEASFDITISYRDNGSPLVTDILRGCRITSVQDSASQGSDAIAVACDLHIMLIERGGKQAVQPLAAPQSGGILPFGGFGI
jgi:hypothetical protein